MDEHISGKFTPTQWAWIVYGLQALSIFCFGITLVIGFIVNLIKRHEVENDPLISSHFSWQMKTFGWNIFWAVVLVLCAPLGATVLLSFIVGVWNFYRIGFGAFNLFHKRSMD